MKKVTYTPLTDRLSWRDVANTLFEEYDYIPPHEEKSRTVTVQGRRVPAVTLEILFQTSRDEQTFWDRVEQMKQAKQE